MSALTGTELARRRGVGVELGDDADHHDDHVVSELIAVA
jgi:hypothetical protein